MAHYTIKSSEGKLILFATILASGMAFLDGTVVNIAIPVMQAKMHADIDGIQWIVNAYALMLAALILISGSLGDRFGRKKIFLYGMGLFVLSSFLCSISHTIVQLIAFRTMQGIGAAMMIPGSLSIINLSFAEEVRGRAIGYWAGLAGGVAALGPFLGGFLVQTFGWPSIFYINIPLGVIAFFLTLKYVPESKNDDARKIDLLGTVFIFLSLLGICYGLIEAPVLGLTNALVSWSLVAGALLFTLFVYTELKIKEALVPILIFKSPLVTGANLATLFLYFALSGVIFFLVLNLQQIQQYPPLLAGLSMLPTILLITFLSGPAGSIADKIGPRLPMIGGPFVVAIGMSLLALSGKNENYFLGYLPGLTLFGMGMSFVIAPLTKSALSVEQKFSGAASGVNNAIARIAGLLAVALLGAIVLFIFSSQLEKQIYNTSLSPAEKQQIIAQKNKLGGIEIPHTFSLNAQKETRQLIDNSFLYSFRVAMWINASLAFLSAVISYFMIKNPKGKR